MKLWTFEEGKSKKAWMLITAGALLAGWLAYMNNSNEETGNYQGDFLCKYDDYNTIIKWETQKILDISVDKTSENWLVRYELPNLSDKNKLTIFFRTNSKSLNNNDLSDLSNSLEDIPKDTEILLEWYSDSRWNYEDNLELSEERNLGIKEILEKKWFINIKLINYWEELTYNNSKSTNRLSLDEKLELRKDRKVDIKINSSVIHSWLDKFPADTYLIDFSWSMEWEKEQEVKKYKFKKWSNVYWFNTEMSEDTCKSSLNNQKSEWWTPLWDSLHNLIEKAKKGETITVLTDWKDTDSKKSISEIIDIANTKSIIINFVSIWNNSEDLETISHETKWWFYFVK
jgi:outer membrane protein OmpA-like peptidoglycan-associated protein